MARSSSRFDASSITEEVLDGVSLDGVVALVTGASGGIGLETARVLATHGATVIVACRDVAKAEAALAQAGTPVGERMHVLPLDLASLASVRAAADRVAEFTDRLTLVIANAGVMSCPEGRTVDGFETHLGTNHLGHFVFVNHLVPLLVAGAPSRVVCLASSGHRWRDVDLDDPNVERMPYVPQHAYAASKTANVLYAVELDRRLRERSVRACAVHPGSIRTDLYRHLSPEIMDLIKDRAAKSVPQGAASSVWAGVVAAADEVGGRYVEDCAVAQVSEEEPSPMGENLRGVRGYAIDPARAAALWQLSETMVGECFPLGSA